MQSLALLGLTLLGVTTSGDFQGNATSPQTPMLPVRFHSDIKVGQEYLWRSTTKISLTTFGGKEKTATYIAYKRSRVISTDQEFGNSKLIRLAIWKDAYQVEPDDTKTYCNVEATSDVIGGWAQGFSTVDNYRGLAPMDFEGMDFWSFACGKPRKVGDTWEAGNSSELSRMKFVGIETLQGMPCCKVEIVSFYRREKFDGYSWTVFLRASDGSLQRAEGRAEGEFELDHVRGSGKVIRTIERIEKLPAKGK